VTTRATSRAAQSLFKEYAEARERAPRPLRVLWEIDSILHKGRTYLNAWEEIERTTRGPDGEILATAFLHFCVSGSALLLAAALAATKLLEQRSDSVNMDYLLNLVENDGKRILKGKWREVRSLIPGDRNALDALREQSTTVRDLRDQRIAHVDRNILSGSLNDCAAADAAVLRRLFDRVDGMLHHYSSLREAFHFTPAPEVAAAFPMLSGTGETGIESTFGPYHLHDLLALARLGWNTLPDQDPVVSRSRGLHERLWRISGMILK
jgi:hypothetical protein